MDAINSSLKDATKAAEDLYNSASDPKVYAKIITNEAKSIDTLFKGIKTLYNTDKHEKEIARLKKEEKKLIDTLKAKTTAYEKVEKRSKAIEEVGTTEEDKKQQAERLELAQSAKKAAEDELRVLAKELDQENKSIKKQHHLILEAC